MTFTAIHNFGKHNRTICDNSTYSQITVDVHVNN